MSVFHASRPLKAFGALYTFETRNVELLKVIVHVARSRDAEWIGLRDAARSLGMYGQALGLASSVIDVGVGLIKVQFVWFDGR